MAEHERADHELVPCPTCWLPADLLAPVPPDIFHHSYCPRGHNNTLIPAVLAHLRTLGQPPVDRSA